jgi:hypothetical protein
MFAAARGQTACKAWRTFPPGFGLTKEGTATADRVGDSCEEGITFNIEDDDSRCHPVAPPCTDQQWLAFAPAVDQDRVCLAHTTCVGNQYEAVAAGTHHDRECEWQEECVHTTCRIAKTEHEGRTHNFVKVDHHHRTHQRGYKYHHCAFLKSHERCVCICAMDHPVDFKVFLAGAKSRVTPPPTPSPTPRPPTRAPTPRPTPKPLLTDASQCTAWKRLAILDETLSPAPASSVSLNMNSAPLWYQGRTILEANKAVLLRLTPSGKPRSDVAEYLNSTYPAGSALYIFDTRSPFSGKSEWGCNGECYEGSNRHAMACANSQDTKLRPADSVGGHWVHNGGAAQGPCAFGNTNQRWDGNLNTWDVCADFGADAMTWANKLNLDIVSGDFEPEPEVKPLDRCHGDCDADADCADGFKCFQRHGNEPVPGCDSSVGSEMAMDYCISQSV